MLEFILGACAGILLTCILVEEGRDECEAELARDVHCVIVWEVPNGDA